VSIRTTTLYTPIAIKRDYSLVGENANRAVEQGLAEACWYQSPVSREKMRELLMRRDGPGLRDTIIWFGLLFLFGALGYFTWGTWWTIFPFLCYGVIYASSSDSRWHEAGHGTAFKTDWMNNWLYEVASFMVMRESTPWRWSHVRHHSDTIIVGRDPEISVPRPPDLRDLFFTFFNLNNFPKYFRGVLLHNIGRLTPAELTYIPKNEYAKVFFKAHLYLVIYLSAILLCFYVRSILPLMYIGLPNLYGAWLMPIYFLTQHAGLAENVLDHRLNCRTVYMNPVNRYLYWNMNYHMEHHMFPLVPYHALPRLHALVKADMPKPYNGIAEAFREIIPAVLRQVKDPGYYVKRQLPMPSVISAERLSARTFVSGSSAPVIGMIEVCGSDALEKEEVVRFDHGNRTFALYRAAEGRLYATDGVCTHGNSHLAAGLVKGNLIECPKHNGRFDFRDGTPQRAPVCVGLKTYPVLEQEGRIFIDTSAVGGAGAVQHKTYKFRVVSNRNVATFIKELMLEPDQANERLVFSPGDYLQLEIPAYEVIRLREFDIPEAYARVWEQQHVFDLVARNPKADRRNNYSLASNQQLERTLRFNVRIATPPPGQDCPPGVGSSYVFNLKPGDSVTAIGPFGDFHIKPTQREMVYIGGGAGMAPLRAHLSYLFETEQTARKVSFWYGARSRQELFYGDYFTVLAKQHPNFTFHLALSSPLPEDNWQGHTGFIHEVVLEKNLRLHANPNAVEYYLCGPPMMIKACTKMLASLGVPPVDIAFDEF